VLPGQARWRPTAAGTPVTALFIRSPERRQN
jgi:hypothetical protein